MELISSMSFNLISFFHEKMSKYKFYTTKKRVWKHEQVKNEFSQDNYWIFLVKSIEKQLYTHKMGKLVQNFEKIKKDILAIWDLSYTKKNIFNFGQKP